MPALKRKHASAKQDVSQLSLEQDWDIAQAVGQVVQDLVAQVADEPYGELNRKRPAFTYVLRKFVKESVQAFNDAATAQWIGIRPKKGRMEDEHELPYGIDLVWGTILAEMEKEKKRERARFYQHQKTIRKREQKKLDAYLAEATAERELPANTAEADHSTSDLLANVQLSGSSEDDIEQERRPPISVKRPRMDLSAGSLRSICPPAEQKRISPSPPSPKSDDSDWAEPKPKKTPMVSRVNSGRAESNKNFPIFNPPQRGRGRPRGAKRAHTVQSTHEPKGDLFAPLKFTSETRLLRSTTKKMRVEPDLDFAVNIVESDTVKPAPPKDPFWTPSSHRGPVDPDDLRLRLERYKECMEAKFVLPLTREEEEEQWRRNGEWKAKVEEKKRQAMMEAQMKRKKAEEAREQHRMAQLIETSGESSQGTVVRKETSAKLKGSAAKEAEVITLSSDDEDDLQSMRDTAKGVIREKPRRSLSDIYFRQNSQTDDDDDCQPSTSAYMRR